MVSALWKACSEGDVAGVHQALISEEVDIEAKDENGFTPLIEAIKSGNVEIVKLLLEKGADPINASNESSPESYTTDSIILELLDHARMKNTQGAPVPHENGESNGHIYPGAETNGYPPANYPYYPAMNGGPPPEMYYPPPPQMHPEGFGARQNNLPPPEIASAIPCRYYPACRYGAACLFQHPQGPYFQGPLPPPVPYPNSYDQMPPQPYPQSYYPVPPPSFPPPPQQGPPMPMHGQAPPDMMSPPQGPFSPTGGPQYGPISPVMYSHPGQAPIPMVPPLPPLHQQAPPPGPQSPQAYGHPSSPSQAFAQPVGYPANGYAEANEGGKPLHEDGMNHAPNGFRRGSIRRGTFARKPAPPPCMFFPAGKCKNGNECRFPHVMPPEGAPIHAPFYPARGGGPRPSRGHVNGIDEKMANLSLNDRGHEAGGRGRGGRPVNGGPKRTPMSKHASLQRVPHADEFPVLGGAAPARTQANGTAGPTAAQILQAAPRLQNGSPPQETVEAVKIPVSFAAVATAGADVAVSA
ncbi:unnamed protein product [Mycena citricolor]|uniref:C3H1-type domain-containing protein n=1 Tax=Mycena citricolor TaxID=2018698 RepID=A0AAD2HSN3_9AGAR|nr:unnamed protein product [Mycena citricolor]